MYKKHQTNTIQQLLTIQRGNSQWQMPRRNEGLFNTKYYTSASYKHIPFIFLHSWGYYQNIKY